MSHSGNSRNIRVLIVESQPQLRQLLAGLARRLGLSVSEAGDGESALHSISHGNPHIVVVDLVTPRISGVRLIEEMTLRYGLGRPKVVVLSDSSGIEPARAWLGADACLLKPVDKSRFTALLRRLAAAVLRRSAG